MNRRTFTQFSQRPQWARQRQHSPKALGSSEGLPSPPVAPPYPLSVMLWTVFTGLPFEERLAKVADAGYSNIELVGEYSKWAEADFAKATMRGSGSGSGSMRRQDFTMELPMPRCATRSSTN